MIKPLPATRFEITAFLVAVIIALAPFGTGVPVALAQAPNSDAGSTGACGPSAACPMDELRTAPPERDGAAAKTVTLVFFWAVGCPHCEKAKPFVDAVEKAEPAGAAGQRSVRLPLARAAKITLLHVLDLSERGTPASLEAERSLEREAEHVRTLLAKAKASDRPLVRAKLAFGRAFEEIAREGTKADLVVLGRHGRGGFAAPLLGSTAERVVRSAVAPVLVVGKAPTHGYRHPLAGVDMSVASQRALEFCLRLVEYTGTEPGLGEGIRYGASASSDDDHRGGKLAGLDARGIRGGPSDAISVSPDPRGARLCEDACEGCVFG